MTIYFVRIFKKMVKSALRRRAFVLGGDITKFIGKGHPEFVKGKVSLEDYIHKAVTGALTKTGVPGKEVDRVCIGNFCGQLYSRQGHLGAAVVGCDEGLIGKPAQRFEAACASGGMAFENAVQSIAGMCCLDFLLTIFSYNFLTK